MMNPQYLPPGPNNNAPNNPLGFPPTSQELNGHQNANIYGQMPQNGPPPQMMPPMNQMDMAQKMQGMSLNGQGFPNIPSSQLPPGQMPPGMPPTSSFGGQLPPGQHPGGNIPGRPPVSGTPQQFPPGPQKPQMPANMAPNSQPQAFGQPPMQAPQSATGMPPTSMHMQGPPKPVQPPSSQPSQQPQGPPSSQHQQFPPQAGPMGHSGAPQHQPGMPPIQMTATQPGQIPSSQPGLPPSSQPGLTTQPMPPRMGPQPGQIQNQPGLPPQPGSQPFPGQQQQQQAPQQQTLAQLQSQMGRQPGSMQGNMMPQPGQIPQPAQLQPQQSQLPPQPGQFTQPGQLPPQPGQIPSQQNQVSQLGLPQQPGFPPQPGHINQQQGFPAQPGQMNQHTGFSRQPGQINQQPGFPPQPGPVSQQPGFPPQPGQINQQPGFPPQPGQVSQQPGFPPQPGQINQQPGFPPQPGQVSQQPGFPQQPQLPTMPGLPHMPPAQSQGRYPQAPPAAQSGYGKPPGPPMQGGYPGAPPMPGQPPMAQQPPSGYPPQYQQPGAFPAQQPSYGGYEQQQQKRLDPDNMPSPIQVMLDDQQNRGGIFVTNDKGLVPPLVTTDFIVDDKGNASPRYIRSSMYSVPVTADLLKQTCMPFCLVISPMAETVGTEPEPPLLDFAALTGSPSLGPVRCARCKAYMCPSMKFVDAARHFKCAFCKATTEVAMEYTQYVNSMQQYGRVPAEMALGAYEIVATKEYCRNNTLPNPPALVFVIDVSYNAIKNGLVQAVCGNIMNIIEAMPKDEQTGKSWTRVGFITYSSTVHFYNIKGSLAQPQMFSVGDVSDMFVPLLEGFLVRPEDSGAVLQTLLQQLPEMFKDNRETETILLPAVQAGYEALKAADTAGQLLVFHTSLPSLPAPGKLTNREDRKLLATDKEKQILAPQTAEYNELGQLCSGAGVCVNMFVCNNAYADTATIGQLPRLTGGQLNKYTYFTAELDGPRLIQDAVRVASRPTAHDAVMRVRTSTGVRATDFYGHFFMSNTTDVELAAVDADKAIGIEIKHDDKLTGEDGVYIQAALLYTHRSGQRRLRVLNLALNVAHQLADVYRCCELDTAVNFLTKQAVWALRENTPRQVREGLTTRCAKSLAMYRRHCASPSSAGQLVLPESLKLLPLYTNCLLRSDALSGGPDITCDDRSCAMYRALTADVATSCVYTYPRLLPLHLLADIIDNGGGLPALTPLRATIDKMNDQGVYLLENGVHMLLWVGSQASPEFLRDVFAVTSPQQIDTSVGELPELDNALSEAVRDCIQDARDRRHCAMRLTTMRQHDKLETVLRHFLVEDRGVDGSASYVDYLCHIHKEIRALI